MKTCLQEDSVRFLIASQLFSAFEVQDTFAMLLVGDFVVNL